MIITGAKRIPNTHPDAQQIIGDLTFSNPFEPDKEFKAYFSSPTELIIPREYKLDGSYTVDVIDSSCDFKLAKGYALKDYQEIAVNDIVQWCDKPYATLLLSAGTGSGKTYSMAGLLHRLQKRTIILSHLSMLSTQMYSEMSKNLLNPNIKILDTNDVDKELPDIAICSFQLLDSNRELLLRLKDYYSIVIVDEAENCFTRSRLKTLFTLKPKYQIYLTATPTRELMRQTQGLKYLFGSKVIEMNQPEENKIHSKHMFVDYSHLTWNSPVNTNMYKTSLGKFMMRSTIIRDIVEGCKLLKDNKVRGTFWIVADLNVVQDMLHTQLVAKGLRVAIIRGNTTAKQRAKILDDIHHDILDVVIGSAPLSAGLSIPELSIGFRLLPNSSSDELLEQMRGRLNRFIWWKKEQHPLWVDFLISGSLEYGANKRLRLYRQTTYGVSLVKPQNLVSQILKEIYETTTKIS